jgi:hypothetical protein
VKGLAIITTRRFQGWGKSCWVWNCWIKVVGSSTWCRPRSWCTLSRSCNCCVRTTCWMLKSPCRNK